MKKLNISVAAVLCVAVLAAPATADEPSTDPSSDSVYSAHAVSPGPTNRPKKFRQYVDFNDVYAGHDGNFIYAEVRLNEIITSKALRRDKAKLPGVYSLALDMYNNDGSFNQWRLAELRISRKERVVTVANNDSDPEQDCDAHAYLDSSEKTFIVTVSWSCAPSDVRPLADGEPAKIQVWSRMEYCCDAWVPETASELFDLDGIV